MDIKILQNTLPNISAGGAKLGGHVVAFGSGDVLNQTFALKPVANQPGYGDKHEES